MKPSEITFSINRYDEDGVVFEEGVFLNFGQTSVKAANSIDEFKSILFHFEAMIVEMESDYL
jgi:hypothetical protein